MNPFTGPGSTPSRRRFWDRVTDAVNASRKLSGMSVTVSEHQGKGTVIDVTDTSPGRSRGGPGGPPVPILGACCYNDGTCDDLTESDCTDAGGNWQGPDTTCDDDPNPCVGACCEGEGGMTCVDNSTPDSCEADGGTFQDFGTTCADPDIDCTRGACCDSEGNCTITTEGECDGTWQGAGTPCEPNPCEPVITPCCDDFGFVGFVDGGTRFLTKTLNFTYSDSSGEGAPCNSSWNQTSVYSIDPVTCAALDCVGSGGGNRDNDGETCDWVWDFISFFGDCACEHGTPGDCPCGPCVTNDCDHGSAITVISNTQKQDTCSFSDPSGFTSSATFTETLSNPCTQSGMSPPP